MKFNLTRQDIATTFIITLSLLVLFCLKETPERIIEISKVQTPSRLLFNNILANFPLLISKLVCVITILACCWKAIRIVINYSALNIYNYTSAILFALYTGIYIDFETLNILISSYFLLCFMEQILKTLSNTQNIGQMFNAYAFLGMAAISYPPAIIYALIWPVTIILTTREWRYLVASLMGIITPSAMYYYICHFFLNIPIRLAYNKHIEVFNSSTIKEKAASSMLDFSNYSHIALIVFTATTLTLVLLAFISSYRHRENMLRTQHNTFIITNYLLMLSLIALVCGHQGARNLSIMAIPLSIIISTYFSYNSGRITNALYFLLILSSILLVSLR